MNPRYSIANFYEDLEKIFASNYDSEKILPSLTVTDLYEVGPLQNKFCLGLVEVANVFLRSHCEKWNSGILQKV